MAKTGLEEGHTVTMFLAGDAVTLLRTESVESSCQASAPVLVRARRRIKASQPRSTIPGCPQARGVTHDQLSLEKAQPAQPAKLLELAAEADFPVH